MSGETPPETAIRDPFTKTRLHAAIAEQTGLTRKQVASVFDALDSIIRRHLKKRGAGVFTLPGLAKFRVSTRRATKARKGINPFTGEETMFEAKPAKRIVRVRALKAAKDMAES